LGQLLRAKVGGKPFFFLLIPFLGYLDYFNWVLFPLTRPKFFWETNYLGGILGIIVGLPLG